MAEYENRIYLGNHSSESALFHLGTGRQAYRYFGVHGEKLEDTFRYTFRVWAPHARAVHLIGDFLDWENGLAMRSAEHGVWELTLDTEASLQGKYYKFAITGQNGQQYRKADPFAFYSETMTKTASIICDESTFSWSDGEWMKKRSQTVCPKPRGFKPLVEHFYSAPLNIYEVHLGSWRRRNDAEADTPYLTYREIADLLAPYLVEMGYTHCQLLPIMEHPYTASLGYQVTGFYAPTSRYGTPDDFRYFVNKMHEKGIGVLLCFMPAYFPKDAHGLALFDGEPLYEYTDAERREDRQVGTYNFDIEKPQVQSFLLSNALYWLREFHGDGLRVSGCSSMLYPGGEVLAEKGTKTDFAKEAAAFFRKLNQAVHEEFPDALTIAEDPLELPLLTADPAEGGLGFNFRLHTSWENSIYRYLETSAVERKTLHSVLTDTPEKAFAANTILPISHEGAMPGRKSVVDKCYGEYDEKFAIMRTMLLYQMTVPGKKLLFMGTEFAQFREWDCERELEWFMTDYPRHVEMQRFVKALNGFYRQHPSLWEIDDTEDGFEWIHRDLKEQNVLAFRRRDKKKRDILVVLNFDSVVRPDFSLCVPKMGRYEEVFTTDRYEFGGKNRLNERAVRAQLFTDENGQKKCAVSFDLPALGGIILSKQQNN